MLELSAMDTQFFPSYSHLALIAGTFFLNVLFGYFRSRTRTWSLAWFFWTNASVIPIIYLMIKWNVSPLWIPILVLMVAAGQLIGGYLYHPQVSEEDIEKSEHISDGKIYPEPNEHVSDSEIAVVLLNMGGPKTIADVKDFLYRLFSDSLIIRLPWPWLTQKLFAMIIVNARHQEAQKRYALIGGGSPIYASTEAQTMALEMELKRRGRNLFVTYSFNYSDPLPEETLAQIRRSGQKYILPVSLYPHNSFATTGSNMHYLNKAAKRVYPSAAFLPCRSYYLADSYINAFVDRILEQLKPSESLDDFYLLFSAHGLPLYFLLEGDPYAFEIAQTVARIVDRLKKQDSWVIAYQSAVGPMRWLKPSTEAMINHLAKRGIKKLLVVPVSFVSDHIETLCEIDIEYRAVAESAGIKDFRVSKALECHPGFIHALADCVENSLGRSSKRQSILSKIRQELNNVL